MSTAAIPKSSDSSSQPELSDELLVFLKPEARDDIKLVALQHFAGLSGTDDGRTFIGEDRRYIRALAILCWAPPRRVAVVKMAAGCLVNVTGDTRLAAMALGVDNVSDDGDHSTPEDAHAFALSLIDWALNPDSSLSDTIAMLLTNLSRVEEGAAILSRAMLEFKGSQGKSGYTLAVQALCNKDYNTKGASMDFLSPFLGNLTQVKAAREALLGGSDCLLRPLLPFTQHPDPIRRRGAANLLKNCCFDHDYHSQLLGDDLDALPRLLYPLAGGEEMDEAEQELLPPDLQYLDPGKKREESADIRKMLLEGLLQLCATRGDRETLRSRGVYPLMREYDNWEQEAGGRGEGRDPAAQRAALKVIEVLIREEEEIGTVGENMSKVEVPEKYVEKFEEWDKAEQEEIAKEREESEKEEGEKEEERGH